MVGFCRYLVGFVWFCRVLKGFLCVCRCRRRRSLEFYQVFSNCLFYLFLLWWGGGRLSWFGSVLLVKLAWGFCGRS